MANDYPLYCYDGLSNHDFAGWYSVSSPTKCNDFCFWKQPDEYYEYSSATTGNVSYTTADPHQMTKTFNGATWGCLINATGDDNNWNNAFDIYQDYNGGTFPHLKCSRGAGQRLKSTAQDLANSIYFWWAALSVAIFILGVEMVWLIRRRRWTNRATSSNRDHKDSVVVDASNE